MSLYKDVMGFIETKAVEARQNLEDDYEYTESKARLVLIQEIWDFVEECI